MTRPNLPYQLGKTFTVGNKKVHTRTIFSQRMSSTEQQLLQQCCTRADRALAYCKDRALARAPGLRNGTYVLGPFNSIGDPTVANFSNDFLTYFRFDSTTPVAVVADAMDSFRHACDSIRRGLAGAIDIVDMPIMRQGKDTCGYVHRYEEGGTVLRRGAIHLDFGRITAAKIDEVADTLIHEGAHKFVAAADHAYRSETAKWGKMTSQMAIENADTISGFAMHSFTRNLP
jgi:hypothetical protein